MYPQLSFFATQEPKEDFWSYHSNLCNVLFEEHMSVSKKGKLKQYRFAMTSHELLWFKKKTTLSHNFENSFIELIRDPELGPGLKITKNHESIQLFGDSETWFNFMKQRAIQKNFTAMYSLTKKIGKGNFADVYKAISKSTGQEYAVKVFQKKKLNEKVDKPAIIKEISILRKIQHDAVLKLFEVFESDEYIFLILELLRGGELYKALKKSPPLSEGKTSKIIYTLLKAVQHIHDKGILHRDIKPENIIIRNDNIEDLCIADFGLADYYSTTGEYQFTRCGTPGYVAPELLQDCIYDYRVDIYSIGVLMYIMICGKQPFEGKDYDTIVMKNYYGKVAFDELTLSKAGMDLIKALLNKNPNKRLTATEALSHEWFEQENPTKTCQFKIRKTIAIRKQFNFSHCASQKLSPLTPIAYSYSPSITNTQISEDGQSPTTPKPPSLRTATGRRSVFKLMK